MMSQTSIMRSILLTAYRGAGALVLAVSLIAVSMVANPARVSAAPFTCDDTFYQVIFGTLNELDPLTGNYVPIGFTGSFGTNAIGYNPIDNYIYGWRGNTDGVVRIEHDATTTVLGVPAGLPSASYAAGDFDNAGNYYLLRSGTTELYRVDLGTNTATLISLSVAPSSQEIVFLNGLLYTINNTHLFVINPSTGAVNQVPLGITPDPDSPTSVYGAGWAANNSNLFFARNSDGMIFEINGFTGSSPVAIPVLQGESTSSNDGASCASGRSPIPPLFATNDVNATTINKAVSGNVIPNDSGRQITVTSYTQPANGSVTVNPDGSYTYTPNNGFTGQDSFTYTITDEYGESRTATVTITVAAPVVSGATLASTGVGYPAVFLTALALIGGGLAVQTLRRYLA